MPRRSYFYGNCYRRVRHYLYLRVLEKELDEFFHIVLVINVRRVKLILICCYNRSFMTNRSFKLDNGGRVISVVDSKPHTI